MRGPAARSRLWAGSGAMVVSAPWRLRTPPAWARAITCWLSPRGGARDGRPECEISPPDSEHADGKVRRTTMGSNGQHRKKKEFETEHRHSSGRLRRRHAVGSLLEQKIIRARLQWVWLRSGRACARSAEQRRAATSLALRHNHDPFFYSNFSGHADGKCGGLDGIRRVASESSRWDASPGTSRSTRVLGIRRRHARKCPPKKQAEQRRAATSLAGRLVRAAY